MKGGRPKMEQSMPKLTEDEIDEIVISQIDDDEAWEEEISVTPVVKDEQRA